MQYNSTICAISMLFKKYSIHRAAAIKRECTFFVPFYFDFILLKEKCTKDIYRCLNNIEVIPTSINKWNTVLSTYLSNNTCVTDIFKVCFKTTSDSVMLTPVFTQVRFPGSLPTHCIQWHKNGIRS